MNDFLRSAVLGTALLFPTLSHAADPAETRSEDGRTLGQLVHEIDQLRDGEDTPFKEVEQRAQALLDQFKKPEEQALIYYTVTLIYSQTGQTHPRRTAHFAEKTAALPLDPVKKLKTYIWWGDALQWEHRRSKGEAYAKAREAATAAYLKGLKLCLDYNVPEQRLEPPDPQPNPNGDGPGGQADRESAGQDGARIQHIKLLNSMVLHRDSLEKQIIDLHLRRQPDLDELKRLADEILKDKEAVEKLTTQAQTALDERNED